MNTFFLLRLAALLVMSLGTAFASQFTSALDVCLNVNCSSFGGSYTGPNGGTGILDIRGGISDGGMDAFDFFGFVANLGPLTLNRRVDALTSQNTYRFLDTYTNPTNLAVSQTVFFEGNLAHNGNHTILLQNPFLTVDKDNTDRIPTVAIVNGNNDWAKNNMSVSYNGREYILAIHLTLDPGQSVNILNFAFLAFDTGTVRNVAGDSALAQSVGQNLVGAPNYSGLSAQDINKTVNFTPEPATAGLAALGIGLAVVTQRRRNQRR
jgi:hypothetical protein